MRYCRIAIEDLIIDGRSQVLERGAVLTVHVAEPHGVYGVPEWAIQATVRGLANANPSGAIVVRAVSGRSFRGLVIARERHEHYGGEDRTRLELQGTGDLDGFDPSTDFDDCP